MCSPHPRPQGPIAPPHPHPTLSCLRLRRVHSAESISRACSGQLERATRRVLRHCGAGGSCRTVLCPEKPAGLLEAGAPRGQHRLADPAARAPPVGMRGRGPSATCKQETGQGGLVKPETRRSPRTEVIHLPIAPPTHWALPWRWPTVALAGTGGPMAFPGRGPWGDKCAGLGRGGLHVLPAVPGGGEDRFRKSSRLRGQESLAPTPVCALPAVRPWANISPHSRHLYLGGPSWPNVEGTHAGLMG